MKKKSIAYSSLISAASLLLFGCSTTQTADAYGLNTSSGLNIGDLIYHENVTLSKGDLTSVSLEEIYSPAIWARVDSTSISGSSIETIEASDVTLLDGTLGTVQYAKHIKIGQFSLTGSLRDEDAESSLIKRGEVVKYTFDSTSFSVNDLSAFLATDSSTYRLGPNAEWYYKAVMNDEIHLLGYSGSSAPSSSASSFNYNVNFKPYFPATGKVFNKDTGREEYDKAFKTLSSFLLSLKQLDYVYKTTDADDNEYKCIKVDTEKKTYLYNTGYSKGVFSDDNWLDTGVSSTLIKLNSIKAYFESASYAYASQEYNSKK